MKTKRLIEMLQDMVDQKPEADVYFDHDGYGFELQGVKYDPDNNRVVVEITDQDSLSMRE